MTYTTDYNWLCFAMKAIPEVECSIAYQSNHPISGIHPSAIIFHCAVFPQWIDCGWNHSRLTNCNYSNCFLAVHYMTSVKWNSQFYPWDFITVWHIHNDWDSHLFQTQEVVAAFCFYLHHPEHNNHFVNNLPLMAQKQQQTQKCKQEKEAGRKKWDNRIPVLPLVPSSLCWFINGTLSVSQQLIFVKGVSPPIPFADSLRNI